MDIIQLKRWESEWVEIMQPKTREPVFLNITTGECTWNPPSETAIKQIDANQWWQLYDDLSKRYYYHNPLLEKTVWRCPLEGYIIPVAKLLQTFPKMNHEKKDVTVQVESELCSKLPPTTQPHTRGSSHSKKTRREEINTLDKEHTYDIQRCTSQQSVGSSLSSTGSLPHKQRPAAPVEEAPEYEPPAYDIPADLCEDTDSKVSQVGQQSRQERSFPRTNPTASRPFQKKGSPPEIPVSVESNGNPVKLDIESERPATVPVPPPHGRPVKKSQLAELTASADYAERPQSMLLPNHERSASSVVAGKITGSPHMRLHNSKTASLPYGYKPGGAEVLDGSTVGWSRNLFRPQESLEKLVSWSKESLSKPLLASTDKVLKKHACDIFKQIQMYMGDRKSKVSRKELALAIAQRGLTMGLLRSELYMQLCKQTTNNPDMTSQCRGWELICVCLSFFPPSMDFQPFLEAFITRNGRSDTLETGVSSSTLWDHRVFTLDESSISDAVLVRHAAVAHRRFARIVDAGPSKISGQTITTEKVHQAKASILCPGLFESSLEEVMAIQSSTQFRDRQLPWIMVVLCEEMINMGGLTTEGIFRIPGDHDVVHSLKSHCERWEEPASLLVPRPDGIGPPQPLSDPHIPASLLKLWLRDLETPLIPSYRFDDCLEVCEDPMAATGIAENLPDINRLCLKYLVRFLQKMAREENSQRTKMDASNLAMVMAPNVLRSQSLDPQVILSNSRPQMCFLRTLIVHLDTSDMNGVL